MTKIELKYSAVESIFSKGEVDEILEAYLTEKEQVKLFVDKHPDLIKRGIKNGLISSELINSL